jgi:hypothetical protein
MAKKSKPATGRKKARPAPKAGRKPAAKAAKRPAKAAARKAPAKRKTAKPVKAGARKQAPRKATRKPAAKKAPVRKAETKRAPVKKTTAPAKAVAPKPAPKAAPKAAPAVAPRRPPPEPAQPAPAAVAPVAAVPAVAEPVVTPAPEAKPGLPAIRPYRGTQGGRPTKGKARPKKRARNRFSKIFAEFETRPAAPERKKKRRSLDEEEEETTISVLRERPKLQIESPEQIRAGVLKKYLETGQPSCPVGCGGIAEVVRVGTLEDGTGEVWIECLSCAQRERFLITRATLAEQQAAQHAMEEAGEALCPRHGRHIQLRRRGRDLVCPDCGVLYPEP